jgi:hypothetical protein
MRMNLVERVRNIILAPQVEWAVIDAEPTDIREIYARYVAPLALVPAVAGFIGGSLIGIGVPGVGTVRVGVAAGLFGAVLQFLLLLGFVYVLALVINALAPMFGGRMDIVAAFKVAAYASTPAWLAGVFAIVPAFAFLSVVGLYGLYLLFLAAVSDARPTGVRRPLHGVGGRRVHGAGPHGRRRARPRCGRACLRLDRLSCPRPPRPSCPRCRFWRTAASRRLRSPSARARAGCSPATASPA